MEKGITVTFTFNEDWKRDYDGIIPELIMEDAIRELADGVGYEITPEPCEGNQQPDTEANAINILLTAGAYLGSLVGKEVSVEPGFIYECRGFNLNENGSGTLYGKNGFCTFGSYKAVRPCR